MRISKARPGDNFTPPEITVHASVAIEQYRLRQPSLNPGPHLPEQCLEGDMEALAIRDAWKCPLPVALVTQDEMRRLREKAGDVFYEF